MMMEEVHKGSSSSVTPSQPSAVQGTTLQAAQLSHIAQQMSLRGSAPLTVVQLPGEQVQVQGVIQTAQSSSVIHSPQVQTVQVSSLSESEDSQDSSDSIGSSQKARGILARRPSYRKILKDLSSEDTRDRKGDEESPGVSTVTSMSVPTPIYQTSTGQYIAIAANGLQLAGPGADGVQGLQTLTMANTGTSQPGTTILQYAQTSDGQQILVPSNQVVVQTGIKSQACSPFCRQELRWGLCCPKVLEIRAEFQAVLPPWVCDAYPMVSQEFSFYSFGN
ncbi:Cyclic AMP-dependent transcription factor ATF-1 [Pitangus sulphuratus]|nr:Cyclic AMP-dependent transcription factor ATF-1 [Pitangus sulphuratus]